MHDLTDMKLVYINDELVTGDGSNSHAVGMLRAFEKILGKDNVYSYPRPQDGSGKPINLGANNLRNRLKAPLAVIRYFRKKYLSIKKSKEICSDLEKKGFVPTHILARSTDFDITAIYVARKYHAKLIYEINTPMFYERGVIKKEPMIGQIEKWEKRIIDASDSVYVVSNICRDMLCNHYSVSKNKFIVIPNGYMDELYHEDEEERREIRNRIRIKETLTDRFVVTFVGSLKVWHGIKAFCETAKAMESDKDVTFMVLGDGEMHDMINDYASTHTNMIFKGKVNLETMKQYLYASDLGIMPYENKENFYYSPLKMYDMIGAGLSFISVPVGQIREFFEETGNMSFCITDTNPQNISKQIRKIKNNKKAMKYDSLKYTWHKRSLTLLNYIR